MKKMLLCRGTFQNILLYFWLSGGRLLPFRLLAHRYAQHAELEFSLVCSISKRMDAPANLSLPYNVVLLIRPFRRLKVNE